VEVLVVAATPFELGWVGASTATLACGIGPVEAAAATAAELARSRPAALLHVGIAGARADAGLAIGVVVLGSRSVYDDLSAAIPVERAVEASPQLLEAARRALPDAPAVEIATSAGVGRSATGAAVEAMEGFGVLRAAALAGVPALELRVVSNEIGEEDRGKWDIPGALAVLAAAGAVVLAALEELG
jgi:futalosine hydrolase